MSARVHFHEALEPLMEPATALIPHPQNPNNGDIDEIIGSILTNGVYRPVYAAQDGTILAGHHLYAALLELGCVMVPVIRLQVDASGARRILLADNRIAALAKVDDGLLAELLQIVAGEERGLVGTGYDDRYLDDLLERAAADHVPLHEELLNTVTCPECGHQWVRGGDHA